MSAHDETPPPDLVADKYKLTRMLGRGGMGSVWEGVHVTLGTRVAVKFIESEYADSPDARSRFENEARAAATLSSKHVVQVYDHGVMPDGRPYIVMEFLAGEPLDSRLDKVGRLSPQDTVRILMQVARALAKAHQAGIVHRDLKPENVFLVWDDEDHADIAKVVDFGIAKFTAANMGVSSSTRTGSVLGTPYFMSPEQARGLRTVDHRTDLWALGVIAYRCLVGVLPFQGEAVGDLLVKICTAPLPIPSQVAPGLPQAFDAWFFRALDREPANRYPTAVETIEALAACFGGRAAMASVPDQSVLMSPHVGQQGPMLQTGSGSGSYVVQPAYAGQPGMYPGQTSAYPGQAGYPQGAVPAQTGMVPGQTSAAFNLTPPMGVPKKSNAGVLIAVGIVGVLLLGLGGAGIVALAMMGGSGAAAGQPSAEPSGAPPASVAAPIVPAPSASVAVAPRADASTAAADSSAGAKANDPTPPAATTGSRPVVAVRQPVAHPPPARTGTQAPPPPATTKPPKTGGGVDVGY